MKHNDGSVRDALMWHFPNSIALESTIRVGDYKLIRNYDHVNNNGTPELELFRLYETTGETQKRVDIGEAANLATKMPEKTEAMNRRLTEMLTEMKASYPYYNPGNKSLPGRSWAFGELTFSKNANGLKTVFRLIDETGKKLETIELET